jgi:N-acetylglucosaminyldiphosphoundecaprenol N-acetyl-beta-D-mannosaminyltransferase
MNSSHAPKTDILSFPVFSSDLESMILREKTVINTLNQYSYMMAVKNSRFKEALMASDVLLPDGVGIVAACKILNGRTIKKIAGADLHQFLLQKLGEMGGSCFYLGASNHTLERIKVQCEQEFPKIKVGYYSPPYKKEFDEGDNKRMIDAINAYNPDVLFIGLSAPKQEMWVHQNKHELHVKAICSIGAVFDFYAGTINRPSKFWVNMGMEWFVRFVNEPSRLWKRYLYYGPAFVYIIFKKKVSQSVDNQNMDIGFKIIKLCYRSLRLRNTGLGQSNISNNSLE